MKKIIVLALFLSGCIEFSKPDKDVIREFKKLAVTPKFGDLLIRGRNIHYAYIDQQKETLIIWVHGSPGSWSAFLDFFKTDSLLKKMDMLSIDRPGFGASDFGKAEPSIEKQANFLYEVTRKFNHPKKILVGHSLGAPVIARMAMDFPDAFEGLIFVAPSIDPEMEKKEWYRNAIDTRVGSWITPKDFEVSNDEIMPLRTELEKMVPHWVKIKIPCIVIQGTADTLVPKENAYFADKMIADSLLDVRLLEGADHFIPWSHPEEIVRAIKDLISL